MATQPSFDPNVFNSGVSGAQWRQWTATRATPLINKATNGLYAPGSTFKMVVALAGAGGAGDHAGRARVLPRPPGSRRHALPLPASATAMAAWICATAHQGVAATSISTRWPGASASTASPPCRNRFGLGVDLDIELPGARRGLVPTRAWRQAQGKPWTLGDTIVHGIGQGFYQLTPLQLATMTARLATGRAVQPHLTRAIGGRPVRGGRPEDWPSLGIPERDLRLVRDAMWAVVNEGGGTAGSRQAAGRDRRADGGQDRHHPGAARDARAARARLQRRRTCRGSSGRMRCSSAYAPHDNPLFAVASIVEHGMSGSARRGAAGARRAGRGLQPAARAAAGRPRAGRRARPGRRAAPRR